MDYFTVVMENCKTQLAKKVICSHYHFDFDIFDKRFL